MLRFSDMLTIKIKCWLGFHGTYLLHNYASFLKQEKCNELLKVLTTKICINGYFITVLKVSCM